MKINKIILCTMVLLAKVSYGNNLCLEKMAQAVVAKHSAGFGVPCGDILVLSAVPGIWSTGPSGRNSGTAIVSIHAKPNTFRYAVSAKEVLDGADCEVGTISMIMSAGFDPSLDLAEGLKIAIGDAPHVSASSHKWFPYVGPVARDLSEASLRAAFSLGEGSSLQVSNPDETRAFLQSRITSGSSENVRAAYAALQNKIDESSKPFVLVKVNHGNPQRTAVYLVSQGFRGVIVGLRSIESQ